jgi:hypothetical protein
MFAFFVSASSFGESKNFGLEKLEQDKDFESGCSCSVTNSKNEFLVVSDLQDKAPAVVRVGGNKLELKWISSTEKSGSVKKGDTFNRVYGDANLKLKLNYKTTFVCGKDDESCEVTRYSVDTTLEEGKKKSEMKNLKGDCGC